MTPRARPRCSVPCTAPRRWSPRWRRSCPDHRRRRPRVPSGHTGGAASIGLALAVLLIGVLPVTRPAAALSVLAGVVLLAGGVVGAGMVRIGAHYATDTVGGFCAALALGLGAAMVIDRVADRRIDATGPRR